jgi:hypothetical protein
MDRFEILEETENLLQKNRIALNVELMNFIANNKNQKVEMLPDYFDEETEFTTKHHTLFIHVKSRPASSELPDIGYIALKVADGHLVGRADEIVDLVDEVNYLATKLYHINYCYKEQIRYYI